MASDGRRSRNNGYFRHFKGFHDAEDGAVTVDWVAVTGFTIALGMGAAFYLATSVPKVADRVGEHLEETPVMPEE